jgi:transposase-like protein
MHQSFIWSGNLNSYKEFKDSTVQLALNSDEAVTKIASDLDIHVKTLYSWISTYKKEHNMQKTEQTGHPSRNHPATKNGGYPATYDEDDSATFYKVRDFILS